MTHKEAFERIKLALAKHLSEETGVSIEKHLDYIENDTDIENVGKALNELEELKRYPTSDEVCEAFKTYYKYGHGEGIKYDELSGEFRFFNNTVVADYSVFGYRVLIYLPPHFITLIGRFYEGLEEMK